MGTATHSLDTDQRRVSLPATVTGTNSYRLALPADHGVLVPGTWMLFALDASGTPTTAATLHIS